MKSLTKTEKVWTAILLGIILLILAGIVALLILPGGLLAKPKMSSEDAIAKWHIPIGTAGILSFLCDEALIAAETPAESRMPVQFGIAAVVYPMLIGIPAGLQQWHPSADQEGLKRQIRDEATALTALVKVSAENWENDTSAPAVAEQCQALTTLEATIIKRAKSDGATEADIQGVLSEDLEIEE